MLASYSARPLRATHAPWPAPGPRSARALPVPPPGEATRGANECMITAGASAGVIMQWFLSTAKRPHRRA